MLIDVIRAAVAAPAYGSLDRPLPHAHRDLQRLAEACTYTVLLGSPSVPASPDGVASDVSPAAPAPTAAPACSPGSPAEAVSLREQLLSQAAACLGALAAQQGRDGLFLTGDNVESPPDSSFTANGLARLFRVCRGRDEVQHLADAALDVLTRLAPGLLTGGVHTPNHRWELAAALAQLGDLLGDESYGARADEWLAEGIDAQEDGLYSERSPNYAALVTNPCLLALADLRVRPDLVDVVHANLHAQQLLTDRTGRVETLQSRRQDQKLLHFPASHFALLYRQLAHLVGCGECGAAALEAQTWGPPEPLEAAAAALVTPELLADPPVRPRTLRTGWTVLETSEVALHRSDQARLLVRAAPDVAALGRVASGAAANPTFAHLRVTPVGHRPGWAGTWLSSVRLSRAFFGLGPFRATSLELEQGRAVLRETQAAAYYQPNPEAQVRYGFEGRFAAEMGFDARRQDLVALETEITVTPLPWGLELAIATQGPVVPHHVELGFDEPSLEVEGATGMGGGAWVALGPVALSAPGIARIVVTPDGVGQPYLAPAYDPGEAYTYLNGTDALGGLRVYVPFLSPGFFRVKVQIGDPSAPHP